ncbi:retrotransposon protein, putative, ty1-copia subclass, partial [Tanacetum coccineum]
GYALESATRILNMVPTKKVDRTPYEIWYGKAPKLSYLRVWGCKALMRRGTPDKLDSRSIKCIFVGSLKETMGYYFYYLLENKILLLEMLSSMRIVSHYKKSRRISQAPDRYSFYVDAEEHELRDINEPPNYKAALSDLEFDKWLDAMNTEMQSIKDNQVWSLVDLPPNGRTVRSKLLFKKKTDMDGNVHTFKALLVAKGFNQMYRVDYEETFSLVADIRAIRILLAIVAFYDYEIWQQAFRSWNKRFDVEIKKIGFTKKIYEPCVYLKASGSNVSFLVLYVDDILIMGNNITMLQDFKSWFCKCFSMKDLGEAAYILRIKIICDRSKWLISLSQSAYFDKILEKFKMENSKRGSTLMQEKPDYRKSQGAQHIVSRFQQNSGDIHWTAVKTILKYLRNTKDMVLVYEAKPESELKVTCYADAGFQTNKDNTKSHTTAMSSTEAEYIVATKASMKAVWMRKFIDGLGDVMPSSKRPIEMLYDNAPAIAIANDLGIMRGARHYQRK